MSNNPLTNGLRTVSQDVEAFRAQFDAGEPTLAALGMRSRLGQRVKRRLYRLMWWQTAQTKASLDLMLRWSSEVIAALESVPRVIEAPQQTGISQRERDLENRFQWLATTSSQRARDFEERLQKLEAAVAEQAARGEEQQSLVGRRDELWESLAARLDTEVQERQQSMGVQLARIEADEERLQKLEAAVAEQAARGDEQQSLVRLRDELWESLAARLDTEAQERQQSMGVLLARIEAEPAAREGLARRISDFGVYTHQTRAALSLQEARLSLLLQKRRADDTDSSAGLQSSAQSHIEHRYDALYAAFEDAMRGSRDEIKTRQSVYVGLLRENGIGSIEMPVVDLGCGRGEWLELLKEHGLHGTGVDRNEAMVQRCRALHLPVTQTDALSCLTGLADSSIGAITSFHLVEHLPFDIVIALIDQSLRVLKPGGLIILETPNPANVLVGATNFHFDPTHLKPLPSQMLRFFLEARGFYEVHALNLHPFPDAILLPDDAAGFGKRFNEYFYGPQDYAAIGKKP